MLGITRFILALFVLISHLPHNPMKFNIGVSSVICFYFISGFLMSKSYARFTMYSAKPITDFYLDRVIKLFPQYILIVTATFISIYFLGESGAVALLNQKLNFTKILANITLLPANYVFYPLSIDALKPHPIIPPAWSLSTEFHFYLLLQAIFFLKPRQFVILLSSALVIQFSSFFSLPDPLTQTTSATDLFSGCFQYFFMDFALPGKMTAHTKTYPSLSGSVSPPFYSLFARP